MPSYTYKCNTCGASFEIFMSVSDYVTSTNNGHKGIECPACKSEDIDRVFKVPGILYKGKGFYSTDNRIGKYEEEKEPGNGNSTREGGRT